MSETRRMIGEGIASLGTGIADQLRRQQTQNSLVNMLETGNVSQAVQSGIPIETALKIAEIQQAQKAQQFKTELERAQTKAKLQEIEQQNKLQKKYNRDLGSADTSNVSKNAKTEAGKLETKYGKDKEVIEQTASGKYVAKRIPYEDTEEGKLEYELKKDLIDNQFNPNDYDLSTEEGFDKALGDISSKKGTKMSPFLERMRDKRAEDVITTHEINKVKKEQIQKAAESAKKITQGLAGKVKGSFTKRFIPSTKMLADWQQIKMVLTDAQLMNTANTKGAISDKEMELFAEAAANDDYFSIQRIMPVLEKLSKFIEADMNAKTKTYKHLYGEDPASFLYQEQEIEKDYVTTFDSLYKEAMGG